MALTHEVNLCTAGLRLLGRIKIGASPHVFGGVTTNEVPGAGERELCDVQHKVKPPTDEPHPVELAQSFDNMAHLNLVL